MIKTITVQQACDFAQFLEVSRLRHHFNQVVAIMEQDFTLATHHMVPLFEGMTEDDGRLSLLAEKVEMLLCASVIRSTLDEIFSIATSRKLNQDLAEMGKLKASNPQTSDFSVDEYLLSVTPTGKDIEHPVNVFNFEYALHRAVHSCQNLFRIGYGGSLIPQMNEAISILRLQPLPHYTGNQLLDIDLYNEIFDKRYGSRQGNSKEQRPNLAGLRLLPPRPDKS